MIVIVCGGRDFTDEDAMWDGLDAFEAEHGRITVLVEGGQRTFHPSTGEIIGGADHWASAWAVGNSHRVEHVSVHAEWKRYGRAAGPIRNTRMLVEAEPDWLIAAPGGRGTADMVRQAKAAGVPVWEISSSSPPRLSPSRPAPPLRVVV